MIAPRKTLWSTPDAVIDRVIERTTRACRRSNDTRVDSTTRTTETTTQWFELTPNDVVCDVGCGDGRVLLRWATHVSQNGTDDADADDAHDDAGASHHGCCLPDPRRPSSDPPAEKTRKFPKFVGIDVDPDRIRAAQDELERLRSHGHLHPDVSIDFWCDNALECADRLQQQRVTVYFLYLIPRGLRIVQPLLLLKDNERGNLATPRSPSVLRVITYLSPLDDETPVQVEKVAVPHQPGASWPLYYYKLKRPSK